MLANDVDCRLAALAARYAGTARKRTFTPSGNAIAATIPSKNHGWATLTDVVVALVPSNAHTTNPAAVALAR